MIDFLEDLISLWKRAIRCVKKPLTLVQSRWPFILLAVIAGLHILEIIHVDGYGIGLLIISFLPVLLPLISEYIEFLKLGKDGLEAKIRADNEGKTASEIDAPILFANEDQSAGFPYSVDARRVLATLWHYQKELFGENSLRRWGFGVGIGASDYETYREGTAQLRDDSLVHISDGGICYLTNEGIDFCREKGDILDADGPFYRQFAPA